MNGFNELSLEALLASAGSDPAMADLFGGMDQLKAVRAQQQQVGDARQATAAAVLAIYNTPDGQLLFEYLVGAYIRRFNNVTELGLPMETAIQLHAERDGQRGVVHDLMRLVNEGRKPPGTATKEA